MLNTPLLHPDILRILAQAGHHSKVLIADGNYPASNKRGHRAELISLQLSPGVPTVALQPILKWDFYQAVASDDHVLTIQTADQQPWANLLLSVGCRTFG